MTATFVAEQPATEPPTIPVDAHRWPDVAALPPAGARAAVAGWLFGRAVGSLPLTVETPTGRVGSGGPVLTLHRPDALFRRVAHSALIGFGESYMAGDWDADDLAGVLRVFAERLTTLVPPTLQRFRRLAVHRLPHSHLGTKANSRE